MVFKKGNIPYNYGKKLSEEHKMNIKKNAEKNPNFGMKGKHHNEETKRKISLFHIGKISYHKGLTYEQEYGEERAKEIIQKMSIAKKGVPMSEETKKKMKGKHFSPLTEFKKGHKNSEETKHRLSIALKGKYIGKLNSMYGKHHSEETKKKMKGRVAWNKGIPRSEETKRKISFNHKGSIPFNKGKKGIYSKETIQVMRLKKLGKPLTEEHKNNMSIAQKRLWQNKEYKEKSIKATLKGLLVRPTSFEQKISDLCFKHHLPFIYTGDGRLLIGYKNPDFVCEEKKIIIEVFLDYFKVRDYGSIESYMKERSAHFAKFGYKTIFISEKEVNCKDWEEICLNKIRGRL